MWHFWRTGFASFSIWPFSLQVWKPLFSQACWCTCVIHERVTRGIWFNPKHLIISFLMCSPWTLYRVWPNENDHMWGISCKTQRTPSGTRLWHSGGGGGYHQKLLFEFSRNKLFKKKALDFRQSIDINWVNSGLISMNDDSISFLELTDLSMTKFYSTKPLELI